MVYSTIHRRCGWIIHSVQNKEEYANCIRTSSESKRRGGKPCSRLLPTILAPLYNGRVGIAILHKKQYKEMSQREQTVHHCPMYSSFQGIECEISPLRMLVKWQFPFITIFQIQCKLLTGSWLFHTPQRALALHLLAWMRFKEEDEMEFTNHVTWGIFLNCVNTGYIFSKAS